MKIKSIIIILIAILLILPTNLSGAEQSTGENIANSGIDEVMAEHIKKTYEDYFVEEYPPNEYGTHSVAFTFLDDDDIPEMIVRQEYDIPEVAAFQYSDDKVYKLSVENFIGLLFIPYQNDIVDTWSDGGSYEYMLKTISNHFLIPLGGVATFFNDNDEITYFNVDEMGIRTKVSKDEFDAFFYKQRNKNYTSTDEMRYYPSVPEAWDALGLSFQNESDSNITPDTNKLNPDIQRWGFSNSSSNFGDEDNGYCISGGDYERLISNLPFTIKYDFENRYNIDCASPKGDKWGGSCFGMSASTMRIVDKQDSIDDYGLENEPKNLNDVKTADFGYGSGADSVGSAESVINYYHYQQMLPELQDIRFSFLYLSREEQINKVAELAKSASEDSNLTEVDIWWWENDEIFGHSVIAYGYRELNENERYYNAYPHCILIYDCSSPEESGENSEYNIYFNDVGEWIDPGWGIDATNAHYICASNDPLKVAPIDYKTGTYGKTSTMPTSISYDKNDKWELEVDDDKISIEGGMIDGLKVNDNVGNDGIIALPEMTEENVDIYRLYVPDSEEYKVSGDELDHTFRTDDKTVKVETDTEGSVVFETNGSASVECEDKGEISIESVFDNSGAEIPEKVLLSVENSRELKEEVSEEGIIISGDDLSELVVQTDEGKYSCITDKNKILLQKNDEGILEAFENYRDNNQEDETLWAELRQYIQYLIDVITSWIDII